MPELLAELQSINRRKYAKDVLFALEQGPRRYTDIQTDITVAHGKALHAHTLTNTLEWLQANKYVEHHHKKDGSADYRLTADGEDLVQVLGEINRTYSRRRHRGDEPGADWTIP